jgi:transcriptional regulator with XRE-family HTH domain
MSRQPARQIALTIGSNIRAARGDTTQRELAIALDVPSIYISRWERGQVVPDTANQQRLAELLFDGDVSALYRETAKAA